MIIIFLIKVIFFTLAIAFCLAKLEIEIEGGRGWAQDLPTWKRVNLFSKLLYGSSKVPLTGYHTWLTVLLFLIYHFVFLFVPWTLKMELLVFSQILLTYLFEDFIWFVINPKFGIKKFKKNLIPWHENWLGPVPVGYWVYMSFYTILIYFYISL